MFLYYYSRTGVTRRIGELLGGRDIETSAPPTSAYILLVPSYSQPRVGDYVPKPVKQFLKTNHPHLKGVVGVGNKNFGKEYNLAARRISERFNIPVVTEIDMFLTNRNQEEILDFMNQQEEQD